MRLWALFVIRFVVALGAIISTFFFVFSSVRIFFFGFCFHLFFLNAFSVSIEWLANSCGLSGFLILYLIYAEHLK